MKYASMLKNAGTQSQAAIKARRFRPYFDVLEARLVPAAIHWNIDADGFWDVPGNWDLNRVPDGNDDVVIDRGAANPTVTVRDSRGVHTITNTEKLRIVGGDFIAASNGGATTLGGTLELNGGNLINYSALRITGEVFWYQGITIGVTTVFAGTTHVTGPLDKGAYRTTIANEGLMIHDGTGNFVPVDIGYTIENRAGGVYELQSDADLGGMQFYNYGTVRKTGGSGESIIGQQGGFIRMKPGSKAESLSGKLTLDSNSNEGAILNAGLGAVLDIVGGVASGTWTGTYTGTGAGRVEFSSGDLAIDNNNRAIFNFPQGLFHWTGGNISNGLLRNQGYLQISGDIDKSSYRGGISNEAFVIESGNGNVLDAAVNGGFYFENTVHGVYEIQGDGSMSGPFINFGTVRKTGGSGESRLGNNGGYFQQKIGSLVEGFSGKLTLVNRGAEGGTINAGAGAIVDITGGADTGTWYGTFTGGGAGRVEFSSGVIVVNEDNRPIFNFAAGLFHWTGGVIYGGYIRNVATVQVSGDGDKQIARGGWSNEGTIIQTGLGNIVDPDRGSITNQVGAVYELRSDASIAGDFINRGTFRKTAGAGQSRVGGSSLSAYDATFDVQTGTLAISSNGNFKNVQLNVADGATLLLNDRVNGGVRNYAGLIQGHGAGTVLMQSTFFSYNGEQAIFDFPQGMATVGNDSYFSGNMVNQGYLTFNSSTYYGLRSYFLNKGHIQQIGTADFFIYMADGLLENQGTYEFLNSSGIVGGGYFGGATIRNLAGGVFRKIGGTGTTKIYDPENRGALAFDNLGTVEVLTGTLQFDEPSPVQQLSSGKLTAGAWKIGPGATLAMPNGGNITNNQASVTLTGPGASFPKFNTLNRNEGTFRIDQGKSFTTGSLTNTGRLEAGAGATFQVNGVLTLTATSTVHIDVTGSAGSGQFGKVNSTGTTALAGTLDIGLQGYGPTSSEQYPVLNYASKTGSLASMTGLAPYFAAAVNPTGIVLNGQGTPPDLFVQNVQVPGTGIVGQQSVIYYTIGNLSDTPTVGTWSDALYLSRDKFFSPDDKLFGLKQHTGGIPGSGSYTDSVSATLPAVQDGRYYVIVISDAGKQAPDSDRSNNNGSSLASIVVTVPTLSINQNVTGSMLVGQAVYYRLDIPSERPDVLVQLQAALGNSVELYAAQGRLPSSADYDLANTSFNSASASLLISNPGIETWYVMAIARSGPGTIPFLLSSSLATPVLQDVSPKKMGNHGPVTLRVNGWQLRASDTYELVGPTGSVFTAQRVSVTQAIQADVTFDLHGGAVGDYHVRLVRDGQRYSLDSPITAEAAKVSVLHPVLLIPPSYRAGNILQGNISIHNDSNVDVPAPIVFLFSNTGAKIALTRQEVAVGTDPKLTGERSLVGVTNSSHPGVLRTGEESRIPFWFQNGPTGIQLGLDYQLASATDPIDFALVESQMRPAGTTNERWNDTWPAIKAALGTTWGDYVRFMGKYADLSKDQPSPLPADTQYTIENFPANNTGFYFEAQHVLTFASQELYRDSHRSVSGTVLLNGTTPVAGTLVKLINDDGESAVSTVTNKDGLFRLLNVAQGTYHLIVDGYQLNQPATVTFAGARIDGLQLAVKQGAVISGVVQRSTDAALLKGLTLTLKQGTTIIATAYTNEAGEYRFTGLDAGEYQLQAGEGNLARVETGSIQVNDQEVLKNVDITIPLASIVSGKVTRNGMEQSGVRIQISNVDGSVASAETDSNGLYKFDGLPQGSYTVSTQFDGYAPTSTAFSLGASAELTLPTITLVAASTLTVTLKNDGGISLTGIVNLYLNDKPVTFAETNALGQVQIGDLAGGTYTVVAKAEGYQSVLATVIVPSAGVKQLDLTLNLSAVIHGTVTTTGGQPISNMLVNAFITEAGLAHKLLTVLTDTAGHYSLNVPYGVVTVTFGNNSGIHSRQVTMDAIHNNQTIDVIFTGGNLAGTVLSSDGVTPVTEGSVALQQNGMTVATAFIGSDGTYIFRQLQPGSYQINAETAGGFTNTTSVLVVDNTTNTAPYLTVGTLVLQGTILQNGSPVPNAGFVLIPMNSKSQGYYTYARTDATGHYQVNGLPAGHYLLHVEAEGFAQYEETVSVNSSLMHDVTLDAGNTLSGTVLKLGTPVAGVLITILTPGSRQPWGYAQTDEQGRFSVAHLPAGTFNILLRGEDLRNELQQNVVNAAGMAPLTLNIADAETDLSGILTEESGNPIVNAEVIIRTLTGDFLDNVTTDAAGHYQINRLPAGQYAVTLQTLGYQSVTTNLTLLAGVAHTLNVTLLTAGTDDSAAYEGTLDFLDTAISLPIRALMAAYVREKLADVGGKPSRLGTDVGALTVARPSRSPEECPALWAQYRVVLQWYQKKEQAYRDWNQAYDDFVKNYKAAAALVTLQSINLILKTASTRINIADPTYFGFEFWTSPVSTQISLPFARAIQTITTISNALTRNGQPLWSNLTSFAKLKEVVFDIVGIAATAIPAYTSLQALYNAQKGLNIAAVTTAGKVFAVLGIFNDIYTIATEVTSSIRTLESLLGAIDFGLKDYAKAKVYYEDAVQQYLKTECVDPKNPKGPRIKGQLRDVGLAFSSDPNNKVSTGVGTYGAIRNNDSISFTINFENLASANAPAQIVKVTDLLSSQLDWSTLQLTGIGFNQQSYSIPLNSGNFETVVTLPGDPNHPVRITIQFNPTTGQLQATMQTLDLLTGEATEDAQAGFLPPNDASGRGQGFLGFDIKPKAGLAAGTAMTNKATIVFDNNDPIATNDAVNTIDAEAPQSQVAILPATTTNTSFTVNWSGQDPHHGAGIASYNIFVSINNGPVTIWKNHTTDTSAVYAGEKGKKYSFYSTATDGLGFEEEAPAGPDAVIEVLANLKPSVDRIVLANGDTQRSRFFAVQVYFNTVVSFDKTAFELYLNGKRFTISSIYTSVQDGKTVATLQFQSTALVSTSLPEGSYKLITRAKSIKAQTGGLKMESDHTDTFFRLFGDINGDGKVDASDLSVFNTAFGKKASQAGYLWFLDYDGNGKIDAKDQAAMKARMRR